MEDPRVRVGPFWVVDLSQDDVIAAVAALIASGRSQLAFALHVGGLNLHRDRRFVETLRVADFVYADGVSVRLIAKRNGAQYLERAATTDIGMPALAAASRVMRRPVRVALIGGPDGLAAHAGEVLEAAVPVHVVAAEPGFCVDWRPVVDRVQRSRPDVVLVGMGMPLEAYWATRWRADLPNVTIVTVGGWFGFLTGSERRARAGLQRAGFEWAARLAQRPQLAPRYLRGFASTARLLIAG